jgi:plasmid stabilization system protein ParE
MIVHLSAEAEYDLEMIGDYIERDNPERALSFLYELRSKCLGLADMPERFPLVPR